MKNYLQSTLLLLFFSLISCKYDVLPSEQLNFSDDIFSIILEDSLKITCDQMEMYDYTTHMVYLKDPLPFMSNFESTGSFCVIAEGQEIYTGQLFPAWYSSMPNGPFIWIPSFYQEYIIKFDYFTYQDNSDDSRKDPRILKALKKCGLYHAGLELQIDKFDIQGNLIELQFSIINNDSFNFYIMSPDKMGTRLFHYFTTGLYLIDEAGTLLTHQIEEEHPEPWNSWNILWMDLLESGDSKTYTLTYENFDRVEPGDYKIYFEFPGLSNQVSLSDLIRPEGRIWLGELNYVGSGDLP